jgi:SAM-dependent methyltransferase
MTRLVRLDRGEELSPSRVQALTSSPVPVRLKLLDPFPPLRDRQIVHVLPSAGDPPRARALVLIRSGDRFRLAFRGDGSGTREEEILGRVVAIEQGSSIFSLERGLLALVPWRWLRPAVDVLEALERCRHPFTPSLYLGSPEACLAGVREKYNGEGEVRAYSRLTRTDLEGLERELLARHVKAGGRVLDIGCGAGREAVGFARAGFRVVAIDIAPRMVEAAKVNAEGEGLDITFRVQSVTDLDEPPGSFDGAYWAGSYHHVPGRPLRTQALRRIMRALTPDGVLILMVMYRGRRGLLSRSRLVDLLRKVGSGLARTTGLSEPGDGCLREPSEASDPRETCFFHDFERPDEVRVELEAAGLRSEEVAPGWWVCRPPIA